MFIRKLAITAAATCAALVSTPAAADSTGVTGFVNKVTVYDDSSDNYGAQHGILQVVESGTGTLRNYVWGASLCPGRELAPDMIQLLVDALHNRPAVEIVPSYKTGNGGSRCLVGFTLNYVP
ncbi:hypothetical protein [Nannocystis pusilla]|uniref:Uncharacterized protein n=1 Tax=Nannocystis pusilla TaxID=889268 RepID=A0ABS7TTM4_9BACT|nr:hypothetical protein [Nannocystis pusilla]MBZ5711568.1 hypothetical protein [Nannocystis pusilla]